MKILRLMAGTIIVALVAFILGAVLAVMLILGKTWFMLGAKN